MKTLIALLLLSSTAFAQADSAWRHIWVKATPRPANKGVKVAAVSGSVLPWAAAVQPLLDKLETLEMVPDVCDVLTSEGWQLVQMGIEESGNTQPTWHGLWRRKMALRK